MMVIIIVVYSITKKILIFLLSTLRKKLTL